MQWHLPWEQKIKPLPLCSLEISLQTAMILLKFTLFSITPQKPTHKKTQKWCFSCISSSEEKKALLKTQLSHGSYCSFHYTISTKWKIQGIRRNQLPGQFNLLSPKAPLQRNDNRGKVMFYMPWSSSLCLATVPVKRQWQILICMQTNSTHTNIMNPDIWQSRREK